MLYRSVDRLKEYKFSVLGFGCWSLGGKSGWSSATDIDSLNAIACAIDNGVSFFDTAPVYGFGTSEQLLGKAIKGKRDSLIIASKCGLVWDDSKKIRNNLKWESVEQEINNSLTRLNIDYIDIYQLHWPDKNVGVAELSETIEKIIATEKVKYVGLSNFSFEDLKFLSKNQKVVSFQGLYNILEQNEESYHGISLDYKLGHDILPFVEQNNMAFFPYSPLMQGLLTDNFNSTKITKKDIRINNPKFAHDNLKLYLNKRIELKKIAEETGYSLLELAYAWLKHQTGITSIISGATKKEQVEQNICALESVLNDDLFEQINIIATK